MAYHSRPGNGFTPGQRGGHATAFRCGFDVPAVRAREQFHARRLTGDLRPVDRAGRRCAVQGRVATFCDADCAIPAVPSPAGLVAALARPPVLGRVRQHRRRIPRASHCRAAPGRLAAALHPGGAPALATARPQQAAVGGLRHRRPAQRARRAARQLRLVHEDASLDRRRRIGHRNHAGAAFADAGIDRFRRRGTQREQDLPCRPGTDTGRAVLACTGAQRAEAAEHCALLARHRAQGRVARRRSTDQVQQSRRGGLRCQRAFAADGRSQLAAAAHAAADPIQPRRFRTPRIRSRLTAARRFPCNPSAGAESHHQRPVPLHRRRRAARLPVSQERTARYVDGRHGANDVARPGEGRRRRQPGWFHADAGALRDRGPARTPARDL